VCSSKRQRPRVRAVRPRCRGGQIEVFVPSEGRVPSQGLGSITCHKDPMLYDPRTLSFDESQTQAPLKRRAPLKAQISLVTAVFRPLNHRDIIPQLDTSKMLAMS
jgi:hypothetical protein